MGNGEFRSDGVVGVRTGARLRAAQRPVRGRTSWSLQDGDRRPVRKTCAARCWDYRDRPTMRYELRELSLDTDVLQLRRGEEAVHLPPQAMERAIILIGDRRRVVAKNELYDRARPETL